MTPNMPPFLPLGFSEGFCWRFSGIATALLREGGRDAVEVEVLEVEADVRIRRDYFPREALDHAREVLAKAHV